MNLGFTPPKVGVESGVFGGFQNNYQTGSWFVTLEVVGYKHPLKYKMVFKIKGQKPTLQSSLLKGWFGGIVYIVVENFRKTHKKAIV